MILSPRQHNPLNLSLKIDSKYNHSGLRSRPNSPLPSARRALLSDTPLPTPQRSDDPKYWKRSSPRLGRRLTRLLLWFLGTLVILYGAVRVILSEAEPAAINYKSANGKAYEIVGQDDLPDFPTPLAVTDSRGRQKWTVSIPADKDFPLSPSEYRQICSQAHEVSQHVEDLKLGNPDHTKLHRHHGYYYDDPYYMDIDDAQAHGLLPSGSVTSKKHDIWASMLASDAATESIASEETGKVCPKSLTYVLESEDPGLGPTLMGLWMSYGLAQKEGRAFFIDDTNWAYGSYSTYFKPAPKPACLPPPHTQITPCPHQARHLLVSAATTSWTFGGAFNEQFEDPRKMRVFRQQPMFSMIRAGYEALFELAGEDGDYLAARIDELNTTISSEDGMAIGIHVRHGDRHPLEFQYQKSYLPLTKYMDAAREILYTTYSEDPITGAEEDLPSESSSVFLLATDDPDVYSSSEMSDTIRAQDRISLASKSSETKSKPISGIDDRVGWEGGFFRSVFWSLGLPTSSASDNLVSDSPKPSYKKSTIVTTSTSSSSINIPRSPLQTHPDSTTLALRSLIARAYLLDLAVLGSTSDAIVCGVSSTACRILAVMMDWDLAIEQGMWSNVDGDFDWWGVSWS